MDANQLVYQLRSKMDWGTKLKLLHDFRCEGESKGYTKGWNECSSVLNKSKQIKNKLYEKEWENELEQLREFIYGGKDAVEHVK